MPRCPVCRDRLPKKPAAVSFTASRRVERYWCETCFSYQKGSVVRDFDREDAEQDYSGVILWDLGALPSGHPFAARDAA